MVAVSVRTGRRNPVRPPGITAALPVTMSTVIVSPMARPSPSRKAATIPERAAGTTTREIVCHWVAPMARELSRSARGTACSASSETETIVGMAMKASRTDPRAANCPIGRSNVFASHGPEHQQADKPKHHRRHGGEQLHAPLEHFWTRRGAISEM